MDGSPYFCIEPMAVELLCHARTVQHLFSGTPFAMGTRACFQVPLNVFHSTALEVEESPLSLIMSFVAPLHSGFPGEVLEMPHKIHQTIRNSWPNGYTTFGPQHVKTG